MEQPTSVGCGCCTLWRMDYRPCKSLGHVIKRQGRSASLPVFAYPCANGEDAVDCAKDCPRSPPPIAFAGRGSKKVVQR